MSEDSPEQQLLEHADTIAVIGLSRNPKRDSHIVANHLQRRGYRIVPVHPKADDILGEPAYASIAEIPEALAAEIDIVDVFRPAEEVPDIVDAALEHLPNLQGIWTQKAIRHDEAAESARAAGVTVVQDRCIRTQDIYRQFGGGAAAQEAD
ncbi:MAG: CoA-binding protein [Halobacteriales archaeon]